MAGNAAAYPLALLAEYCATLDSLPIDLSRTFADLRELDAVLSSSIASITSKIQNLTDMIENGKATKEERLWLLTEIADDALRLKPGGEDKIRVACQAADNLKNNINHLRSISEHIPSFDASILDRQTTFPHVTSKIFVPPAALESGRRRRNPVPSLLVSLSEPSPIKRKRNVKDDDFDGRTPRKEKLGEPKPRGGARVKRNDRAGSPTESILSATSHRPPQLSRDQGSYSRPATTSSRAANGAAGSKRRAPNVRGASPQADPYNSYDIGRDSYIGQTPTSHAQLSSMSYKNHGQSPYDLHSLSNTPLPGSVEWNQLEGPGMPVKRNHLLYEPSTVATDGAATEGGEADGVENDGDDRRYCYCNGFNYGTMVGCDGDACEKEWFHLNCIGLADAPSGEWYCASCSNKKTTTTKRTGRGGRRRNAGGRSARGV